MNRLKGLYPTVARWLCLFAVSTLLVSAGCAYSNLGDRPQWARAPELPSEHPMAKKYDRNQFLTKVVTGTGSSLAQARKNCEEEANTAYAKMIMSQVTNIYQSQTKTQANQYQASVQKNVENYVQISTKDVLLSGLQEVLSWDGYEGDKIYYFGCYVLDKKKAGDAVEKKALQKFNELKEIQNNIQAQGTGGDQIDRLSLEGIKVILEFQLLYFQGQFFNRDIPQYGEIENLKQFCIKTVYDAINRKMQSSSRKDLEDALKLAEGSLKYTSSRILEGRILAIKRKLPCLECKFSSKCIQCKGEKGFLHICSVCKGNQRVYQPCDICKGDGKRLCSRCNGVKKVLVHCTFCQGGKVLCPSCKGQRQLTGNCSQCGGNGSQSCQNCVGNGFIVNRDQKGRETKQTCNTCRGSGKLTCRQCRGQGQLTVKCNGGQAAYLTQYSSMSHSSQYRFCQGNGQVVCFQCKGSQKVSDTCPECDGRGRYGVCQKCSGAGRVITGCPQCPPQHKGKVWKKCEHCNATGLCPVCKGRGHRR